MIRKLCYFSSLLLLLVGSRVEAQEWRLLGQQALTPGADADVIQTDSATESFRRIRVRVLRGDVQLRELEVRFKNGETHRIPFQGTMRAGSTRGDFDLPGDLRVIRDFSVKYLPSKGARTSHALLQVYGTSLASTDSRKVVSPPLRSSPPADSPQPDWEAIGEGAVKNDVDWNVITVRDKGRFRQIQLQALDSPVRLESVQVKFGDGESYEARLDQRVRPGDRSRVISLPGGARTIDHVEFIYRAQPGENAQPGEKSRVRLLGMRPS